MNLKLLLPLSGIIAGILFSYLLPGTAPGLILLGISLFFWIIVTFLSKDPVKASSLKSWHSCWIFLLFAGIGALDYDFNGRCSLDREINNERVSVSGVIKDIKYLTKGDRFQIRVKSINDSSGNPIKCRNLDLLVNTDGFMASEGDIIKFTTVPRKIDPKKNAYLGRSGIDYFSNVKFQNIQKIGETSSIGKISSDFRNDLIILVENSSINRETGDFLISVLLGDKTFLPSSNRQILSSAGMAHILAVSGMHVAIILSIILLLLFPLALKGYDKTRKIIAILIIWFYVLLTGASPSTVRAAIMATLIIIAYILERKNSVLNSLMVAAMLIILLVPLSIWDIGLQLSFVCVASILLFTNKLNPVEHHSHPITFKFINVLLITLITTLSSWVLIAYYFSSVPLLFLPANLLLLPLLPAFMATGIFFIFLLSIGIDFALFSKALEIFHSFFIGSADFLSLSGRADIPVKLTLITAGLWLIGILLLGMALYFKRKKGKAILTWTGAFCLILSLLFPEDNNELNPSLKFPHSFTKIEAHYTCGGKTSVLTFPRRNIAYAATSEFNIISIDRQVHPDSLENIKFKNTNYPGYLFIGPDADMFQMAEAINNSEYSKIILHAGIGKNKKAELLHLIDESVWDKIYSLRENGSLEFDLLPLL